MNVSRRFLIRMLALFFGWIDPTSRSVNPSYIAMMLMAEVIIQSVFTESVMSLTT